MKWGPIISDVFLLYFKAFVLFIAYFFAKSYIRLKRPSRNPPFIKQIGGYLICVIAVALLACFWLVCGSGEDEEPDVSSINYIRGVTVFLTLLFPVLLGAAHGYATTEPDPKSEHDSDDW